MERETEKIRGRMRQEQKKTEEEKKKNGRTEGERNKKGHERRKENRTKMSREAGKRRKRRRRTRRRRSARCEAADSLGVTIAQFSSLPSGCGWRREFRGATQPRVGLPPRARIASAPHRLHHHLHVATDSRGCLRATEERYR